MALKDIQLPTKTIQVADGDSFTVRGLSFADIVLLVTEYGDVFSGMFNTARDELKKETEIDSGTVKHYASLLLKQAPELVASAIAISADEPDQASKVEKLRISVQLEAFESIIELTVVSESDLKKVWEIALHWLERFNLGASKVQELASQSGFGASEETSAS